MLARYGKRVTVVESHYHAGGAAHAFQVGGYTFDSGPSFHAGLSEAKSANPLKQVLDAVGEHVPCVTYDRWIVYDTHGTFPCIAGAEGYCENILKQGGPEALQQWKALEAAMAPLQAGAALFPAAGMRGDLGVVLTAGMFGIRGGWSFARTGLQAGRLTGPFSDVVDKVLSRASSLIFLFGFRSQADTCNHESGCGSSQAFAPLVAARLCLEH
jgi:phytoene dehydrogenase-like protein